MQLYERVVVLHDDPEKNMLGTVVGTANYVVDDRDFTTMDTVGTMRTEYVVVLDYNHQGWLNSVAEDGEGGWSFISHLIVHEDGLDPAPWYVNVYERDLGYGGPEEGGWNYDIATPVHSHLCNSRLDAEAYAEQIKDEYPEEGERPVSSVLYTGGAHSIRIENHPPVAQPETIPHYE